MFTLSNHEAKLAHINLREEKHGEESVPAVDLKITADVPNDFLSYLSPTLKACLYQANDQQGSLVTEPGYLPKLRFPELPDMHWHGAMKAELILHGATKKADILLLVEVDKLHLGCKDGGTVAISFRCKARPESPTVGRLAGMLGLEIKASVTVVESLEDAEGVDHDLATE